MLYYINISEVIYKMSYNAKRLLAGAAAAACAVSLSSCGADTKWAARSGDTELSAGIYIYNLLNEYYAAMDHMTDTDTDVLNITIDDKPSREWILEKTKEDLKKYVAVENKFTELGMELSEDDKNTVDYIVNQMWPAYGTMMEGYGISEQSYRSCYTNTMKNDEIFLKYYGEDGITPVSDDEIKQYMTDNYARVNYIALNLKDADGNLLKSDGKKEVMKMAEEYLQRAEDGEDFDALVEEYDAYWKDYTGQNKVNVGDENPEIQGQIIGFEDAEGNTITLPESEMTVSEGNQNAESPEEEESVNSGDETEPEETEETEAETEETDSEETEETAAETEVSETEETAEETTAETSETAAEDSSESDPEESTEPASHETVIKKGSNSPSVKFNDTVFNDYGDNEFRIIEDDEIYYVVRKTDLFSDETYFDTNKNSVLYEMKSEEFTAMVEEWAAAVELTMNDAAVKRYKVDKFASSN